MNRHELESKAQQVADRLLQAKGWFSPVEVFMELGRLTREKHEDWRFRRVRCLEKVMTRNLKQFEFLLKTIRAHALRRGLKPSWTAYVSWGKTGRKPLRFTKTGHPYLEELYATHFVRKRKAESAAVEPQPGSSPVVASRLENSRPPKRRGAATTPDRPGGTSAPEPKRRPAIDPDLEIPF
jgi:hypothetical protein